jgi:hypothetical protein
LSLSFNELFHFPAGTVNLKLSDWPAAARDFESAIGIDAQAPVYHYAFAVALERIGRRNEAYVVSSAASFVFYASPFSGTHRCKKRWSSRQILFLPCTS